MTVIAGLVHGGKVYLAGDSAGVSGWDLILIARPALVTATLEDTRAALLNILRRAKILPADES